MEVEQHIDTELEKFIAEYVKNVLRYQVDNANRCANLVTATHGDLYD